MNALFEKGREGLLVVSRGFGKAVGKPVTSGDADRDTISKSPTDH